MRVLVVIVKLGLGGTEQAMVYLLPELRRLGIQCEVACMLPPYQVGDDLEVVGVPVHRINIGHRWNVPRAVYELSRLHRERGFDIAHGKGFFGSIYAASLRPAVRDACIVASFHNHEYDYPAARPWWLEARRRLQSWELRHWVDAYGALSTETARHYERHLGTRPIVVLPNTVRLDGPARVYGEAREAVFGPYGGLQGGPVIAVPNRLTHEKGHAYLLDALAVLRSRGLRPRTFVMGKGPLHGAITAQIKRLSLDDQVVAPGREIPNPELKRIMASSDVVAVPSVFEAFGLVPAEAMSIGVPVVASATGGLLDLIQDGVSGLLVPSRDPSALADALERVLTSPELAEQLGRGGRRRIEEQFSTSSVAGRFEAFYRDALDARRRRNASPNSSVRRGAGV